MIDTGEKMKDVVDELGLEWDLSPYTPLLSYFPCHAHEHEDEEYDLFVVNFKIPFITFSLNHNVWIDELATGNPYTYNVMLNRKTAEAKGLNDGDRIHIESHYATGEGTVKVTELIHPECIGIPGTLGHWARKLSLSKIQGYGVQQFPTGAQRGLHRYPKRSN